MQKMMALTDDEVRAKIDECDDERLFAVFEAIKRGIPLSYIYDRTKIDLWFLSKLENLVNMERRLQNESLTQGLYKQAKHLGYPDHTIERLSGQKIQEKARPRRIRWWIPALRNSPAETPYFYATYDEENEAAHFIEAQPKEKKTVLVFGSGPHPHRAGHRV